MPHDPPGLDLRPFAGRCSVSDTHPWTTFRCQACDDEYYSSVECQRRGWVEGGHRERCLAVVIAKAAAAAAASDTPALEKAKHNKLVELWEKRKTRARAQREALNRLLHPPTEKDRQNEQLHTLVEMGFGPNQARRALQACKWDVTAAADRLLRGDFSAGSGGTGCTMTTNPFAGGDGASDADGEDEEDEIESGDQLGNLLSSFKPVISTNVGWTPNSRGGSTTGKMANIQNPLNMQMEMHTMDGGVKGIRNLKNNKNSAAFSSGVRSSFSRGGVKGGRGVSKRRSSASTKVNLTQKLKVC